MQFRHVYMNFRQNFSQKKNISPFQKKTLAETVNCIPKGLRKGNPFHGPFAQLSYIPDIYKSESQRSNHVTTWSPKDYLYNHMYNESTLPKWYPDGTIFGQPPHPVTVTNEGWFFRDFATN